MMKTMTLEELNTVNGGAVISQEDELGFAYKDMVIWTKHPEYGAGMYIYGIFGVALVVFDVRRAGIRGSLVLTSELVKA